MKYNFIGEAYIPYVLSALKSTTQYLSPFVWSRTRLTLEARWPDSGVRFPEKLKCQTFEWKTDLAVIMSTNHHHLCCKPFRSTIIVYYRANSSWALTNLALQGPMSSWAHSVESFPLSRVLPLYHCSLACKSVGTIVSARGGFGGHVSFGKHQSFIPACNSTTVRGEMATLGRTADRFPEKLKCQTFEWKTDLCRHHVNQPPPLMDLINMLFQNKICHMRQ